MPKVRCCFCSKLEKGKYCPAKKTGGRSPSVKANKPRKCSKFLPNVDSITALADKEWKKREIPVSAPTWRYYASKKELKELGEETGSKFIRINNN